MTAGSLVSSNTTIAEEAIAEWQTAGRLWVKQTTMLLSVRSLRANGDSSRHGGHHRGQRVQRADCGRAGANGGGGDGFGRGDGGGGDGPRRSNGDGGRVVDKRT
jgi:hypothetical protein